MTNKNIKPKTVIPKATALIGSSICMMASRPEMLPVQVSNGCAAHSLKGATYP